MYVYEILYLLHYIHFLFCKILDMFGIFFKYIHEGCSVSSIYSQSTDIFRKFTLWECCSNRGPVLYLWCSQTSCFMCHLSTACNIISLGGRTYYILLHGCCKLCIYISVFLSVPFITRLIWKELTPSWSNEISTENHFSLFSLIHCR